MNKKILSLGLVAANVASMPVSAAILDDAKKTENSKLKIERNIDNEDTDIKQLDFKSTTSAGAVISPIEDEDKYTNLTNTIREERVITTTGAAVTVLVEVKAPAVVYGNPLVRSELKGKVINKDTNEKVRGEFSWVDGYENLSETQEHQWKFIPADKGFCDEITGDIEVNVRKHDLRAYDVSCTDLYFGDKLEESKLEGKFYDEFGHRVDGNLVWDSPNQTVIEEKGQFHWTFVPDDLEKNNMVKGSLIVNSKKSDVVTPVVREIYSENIYKLDEFKPVTGVMENPNTKEIVKGTFRIINKAPSVYNKQEAEDVTINWEFTPSNTRRYTVATGNLTVKAKLRNLKLSNPTATSIVSGRQIYESVISGQAKDAITNEEVNGVWRWEKPFITVHQSASYSVKFIPNVDNVYNLAGGNAYVKTVNSNNQKELDVRVVHTEDVAHGERIGNSKIIGKAFDKKTGKAVKGEFYWMDPSIKAINEEFEKADYIFIPSDLTNYKPFLGEAVVSISDDDINLRKAELVDISASSARIGQMITNSRITGKALIDGVQVAGSFEWFDKSVRFVQEGIYYETVKFTPAETEKYRVSYIDVAVKVYHENQIEIKDAVLSDKKSLDVKVNRKITAKEAEALKVDGYEIAKIELLKPSNSMRAAGVSLITNGYESSDRIRVVTSEELTGSVRIKVDTKPDGQKLEEELKPDFVIKSNDADNNNGNNTGGTGGSGDEDRDDSVNGGTNGSTNSGTGNGSNGNSGNSSSGSTGNTGGSGSSSGGSSGGSSSSSSKNESISSKNENISSENKNGWVNDKFIKDGNPLKDSWVLTDNAWYFTDSQGNKLKSTWINNNGLWYYLSENGSMKTGWLKDGANWYYLSENGSMKTGWLKDGTNWYHLSENGSMKTGWLKDGVSWYYLSENGSMKTGWLKDGANWYYLNENGSMKTGWHYDNDGVWYYLKNNGEMAANEYIDGYYLGANGALK